MNALQTLTVNNKTYSYYSLASLGINLEAMPFSIRVLLESVLRNCDGFQITEQDVKNLAAYQPDTSETVEIPFKPARVILQDFTGVPAVVDLAAMRSAMQRLGGDPKKINPLIPVDLVIDHSVQTDCYGTADCLQKNIDLEFQRNAERYALLNWAQKSLSNFRVIPPSVGIIHQVNLEYLADVVHQDIRHQTADGSILFPDSCLGTDSHTVMINGLGVLGWGVGGIEAEAVMLGQPYYMLAPQVVGFELCGKLNEGITATDLVLTITEILRKEKVVGKFVEYFGEGAASMPLTDRAVVANMAPEYGATMGYFPVDDNTLQYLRETGRDEKHIQIVEAYCKANSLYRGADTACSVKYTKTLTLDLSTVESCIAGPKRPQDRIVLGLNLAENREDFRERLRRKFDDLAVPLQKIGFTPANFRKLFGKDMLVETPIGKVKVGENQYKKLAEKQRDNLLWAMHETLAFPVAVIKENRSSGEYLIFVKSFLKEQKDKTSLIMSVTLEIEGTRVSISTYQRRADQIFSKISTPADIVYEQAESSGGKSCGYSVNSPSPVQYLQQDDTPRLILSANSEKSQEDFRERLRRKFDDLAVPLERVVFSEKKFYELFGRDSSIETPIGTVKLGEHQKEKLIEKGREDLILAMKETLKNPAVIIKNKADSILFIKPFTEKSSQRTLVSVVIERDDLKISISTHIRELNNILNSVQRESDILWEALEKGSGGNVYDRKGQDEISAEITPNADSDGGSLKTGDRDRLNINLLSANSEKSQERKLTDHSVVIASITSCTNTSNPRLILAAGLLAKKAVEKGLSVPSFVKTSLAPGSRVVAHYLTKSGLLKPLEALGFNIAGYGCMTCIGNSGNLKPEVEKEITEKNLTVAAVLSGNRNFEGRINPFVKENYLASPPLVVAFALAGTTSIDLQKEPLGIGKDGKPVFLRDIFPSNAEVNTAAKTAVDAAVYRSSYYNVFASNEKWNTIESKPSLTFDWDRDSTYIQEPPFLMENGKQKAKSEISNARCLALFGDSITTDHISPAGSIKKDSPAGKYLIENGVLPADFNSYGSRRGNDRVMTRGTFANIRIKNQLVPNTEGGVTKHFPSGEILPIYDAAMRYQKEGTPLLILAGAEYGTGSSRDWAAKGTALLGVKAVIAQSFERIHRGNLVGMGVLPLEFANGATCETLQLTGEEEFTIPPLAKDFNPSQLLTIKAERPVLMNGREMFAETEFQVKVRIDTPVELQYYFNGGILPAVLKSFIQ